MECKNTFEKIQLDNKRNLCKQDVAKTKRIVDQKRAAQKRKNEHVCGKTKNSSVEENNNSCENEHTEYQSVNYGNSQKKCLCK